MAQKVEQSQLRECLPGDAARKLLKQAIDTAQAAREEMRALQEQAVDRGGFSRSIPHGYLVGTDNTKLDNFYDSNYGVEFVSKALPLPGETGSYKHDVARTHRDNDGRIGGQNRNKLANYGAGDVPNANKNVGMQQQLKNEKVHGKGEGEFHIDDTNSYRSQRASSPPLSASSHRNLISDAHQMFPCIAASHAPCSSLDEQRPRNAKLHALKARVEKLLLREEKNRKGEIKVRREVMSGIPDDLDRGRSPWSSPKSSQHIDSPTSDTNMPNVPDVDRRLEDGPGAPVFSASSTLLERAIAEKRREKRASFSLSRTSESQLPRSLLPNSEAVEDAPRNLGSCQSSTASATWHDAWVWPRLTKEEMHAARQKPPLPEWGRTGRGEGGGLDSLT
ncbi:hypothetical protein Naga_100001g209 [Nannochloropsis gaditana]|uniref:Uncharacterized protein n=1 Tax=Nannochloropsis gaditana TaxID=72520 RepID=W7TSY0_9STRA|nr:hypothetical protein Naga_100001g209 [Nannochloropsis gaditana]